MSSNNNQIFLKAATVIYYEYKTNNAIVIHNGTKIAFTYLYEDKKLVYGDAVYGKFKKNKEPFILIKGEYFEGYSPVKEPLVILGRDIKTVKKVLLEAARVYNLDRIINATASYQRISDAAKIAKEEVDDYMDQYSDYWYRNKNKPPPSMLPTPELNDRVFKGLIRWWVYARLLRQLKMFDIDKKMINSEGRSLVSITHDFMENPFKIISLPFNEAKQKFELLFKTPTKKQAAAGLIARSILQKLQNESGLYLEMKPSFQPYLEDLKRDYGVVVTTVGTNGALGLFLPYPNQAETEVAKYIRYCNSYNGNNNIEKVANIKFKNDKLNPEQRMAVKGALISKVSIISGRAGTGKTTIIKELMHQIENELNSSVIVTSFTGKAVTRLKQMTGEPEIYTMDRLIRLAGKGPESDIGPFEYLIIDEVSMVCTELFYRFVSKVCGNKPLNITLVGDINQLPPVVTSNSWGSFFLEISNGNIAIHKLIKNHRSDVVGPNGIVLNSDALVQAANASIKTFKFVQYNNFTIIPGDINAVIRMSTRLIDRKEWNISFEKSTLKIICPYNKLTFHINDRLKNLILKGKQHIIDSHKMQWCKGGLVMLTKNYHPLGVMNGDEGIITDINSYLRKITVTFFNGKIVQFDCDNPKEYRGDFTTDSEVKKNNIVNSEHLIYSYAITVHKSQGSEWEYVIYHLPAYNDKNKFVNFNLTYTAITRPRKTLWIVGDEVQLNASATIKMPPRAENLRFRIGSD